MRGQAGMIGEDKKIWHKCERWERGDGETKEEIKKENHECQEKK